MKRSLQARIKGKFESNTKLLDYAKRRLKGKLLCAVLIL